MTSELATVHDIEIARASYGPEALQAMGLAFDQAWAEISGFSERNGQQSQIMRLKLAKALINVARDNPLEVIALKNAALQSLAMDYRGAIRRQ